MSVSGLSREPCDTAEDRGRGKKILACTPETFKTVFWSSLKAALNLEKLRPRVYYCGPCTMELWF